MTSKSYKIQTTLSFKRWSRDVSVLTWMTLLSSGTAASLSKTIMAWNSMPPLLRYVFALNNFQDWKGKTIDCIDLKTGDNGHTYVRTLALCFLRVHISMYYFHKECHLTWNYISFHMTKLHRIRITIYLIKWEVLTAEKVLIPSFSKTRILFLSWSLGASIGRVFMTWKMALSGGGWSPLPKKVANDRVDKDILPCQVGSAKRDKRVNENSWNSGGRGLPKGTEATGLTSSASRMTRLGSSQGSHDDLATRPWRPSTPSTFTGCLRKICFLG